MLFFRKTARVIEQLEGYIQNKSNDASLKNYRASLQECIDKKILQEKSQEQTLKTIKTIQLDVQLYSKSLKSIKALMQKKSETSLFEECIFLRECIKVILTIISVVSNIIF